MRDERNENCQIHFSFIQSTESQQMSSQNTSINGINTTELTQYMS